MVTGSVTDPTGLTFVPLKPTKGTSDGMSCSLLILIYWKVG